MEFKGTKGEWKLEERYNAFYVNRNLDSLDIHVKDRNVNIAKYDALLISKAPEMLKMLKEVIQFLHKVQAPATASIILGNEINKLIKEATEL